MAARTERSGFDLKWALLVSVALHGLLWLWAALFPWWVSFLLGLTSEVRARPEEPDPIRFSFAPRTENRTDRPEPPKGELPLETPVEPLPQPTPPTRPEPQPADRLVVGAEAAPPAEGLPEASLDEGVEPTLQALPEGEDAIGSDRQRRGVPDVRQPGRAPRQEFDLGEALKDFGANLRQAQAARPKSQPSYKITAPPQLPMAGVGIGNLEFASRDYDWSDYGHQVYMAIWRAWHNQLYQMVGSPDVRIDPLGRFAESTGGNVFEKWAFESDQWYLRHANRIEFTITRSGAVVDIALRDPSGCYPLDDSALDALREVVLPPLPADFPRDRERVRGAFIADGPVRGMKPTLAYLKRAGHF